MARPTSELLDERADFLQTIAECAKKPSKFSSLFLNHKLFTYNAEYTDCSEQFLIYRSGRQAGKTMSTAVKAIHFAFFAPYMVKQDNIKECTIVIAAPTQNQASIMFDRIRFLIEESEFLKGYIIKNTQTEIWLRFLDDTGISRIITRATGETGMTLRGYSPNVIIVDETAFIKTSIMDAFLPSGLATDARVWITSTPFGMNNWFYKKHEDSRPSNPSGLWREFHVKSTDNPLTKKNPIFLSLIRDMSADMYRQEIEGEFVDIGNALIPYSLLQESLSDKKPRGSVRYYMGVDIARKGRDETVFLIMGVDEDEKVYVKETFGEAQSNLVDVAGRIGEYCRKYPIETVYVDETGLGAGVIDIALKQDLPVRGIVFSLSEKSKMYGNLRTLFENHRVKIPTLGKLINQLGMLKREYSIEGKMKVINEDNRDDDYADALALACNAIMMGSTWHVLELDDKANEAFFG